MANGICPAEFAPVDDAMLVARLPSLRISRGGVDESSYQHNRANGPPCVHDAGGPEAGVAQAKNHWISSGFFVGDFMDPLGFAVAGCGWHAEP